MANSKKGTPAPRPFVVIHRPGEGRAKKRKATAEEMRAFFGGGVQYVPPPSS